MSFVNKRFNFGILTLHCGKKMTWGLTYFDQFSLIVIEPGHEKMCLMLYANNKGADQPAHPRSLISAFIVRC